MNRFQFWLVMLAWAFVLTVLFGSYLVVMQYVG